MNWTDICTRRHVEAFLGRYDLEGIGIEFYDEAHTKYWAETSTKLEGEPA